MRRCAAAADRARRRRHPRRAGRDRAHARRGRLPRARGGQRRGGAARRRQHDGEIDLVLLDVVLSDGRGDVLSASSASCARAQERDHVGLSRPARSPRTAACRPTCSRSRSARPSCAPASRAWSARFPRPSIAAAAAPSRVLVVDDDELLRRSVVRALRKADLDVTEADCGTRRSPSSTAARSTSCSATSTCPMAAASI